MSRQEEHLAHLATDRRPVIFPDLEERAWAPYRCRFSSLFCYLLRFVPPPTPDSLQYNLPFVCQDVLSARGIPGVVSQPGMILAALSNLTI